jgi:hypothetical protein
MQNSYFNYCYFCVNVCDMKKSTLLFALIFSFLVKAQTNIQANLVSKTDLKATLFLGKDNAENLIFIAENKLIKKDSISEINYNNINLNNLNHIDFYNPLKSILHYKNSNQIIVLDAQFNEVNNIKFQELLPVCMSLASQNEIWFYDEMSQKFGLFNLNTEKHKFISNNIGTNIKSFFADYNHFYWIDENHILHQINRWGKISEIATLPEFDKISINNDEDFVFKKNDILYHYNIKTKETKKVNLTEKLVDNFFYNQQKLTIFTNFQINNYIIK